MRRGHSLGTVLLVALALVVPGCKEPDDAKGGGPPPRAKAPATLPPIDELAQRLPEYAAAASRTELRERVDFIGQFVKRMQDEGRQDSRPVEIARTTESGV